MFVCFCMCLCICVCACVLARVRACVCVYVCEIAFEELTNRPALLGIIKMQYNRIAVNVIKLCSFYIL